MVRSETVMPWRAKRIAAIWADVGAGAGTKPLQALDLPGPDPAVQGAPAVGAGGAVGQQVGAAGQLPDQGAPLGGAQPGVGGLGDDREAVDGDGFGRVSWHPWSSSRRWWAL